MKSSLFNTWSWLSEHDVFNIETIITKKDLPEILADAFKKEKTLVKTSYFERGLDITVVSVNPKSKEIDLNFPELNTQDMIWLEVSIPIEEDGQVILSLIPELNSSGETFEIAISELREKILNKYGN